MCGNCNRRAFIFGLAATAFSTAAASQAAQPEYCAWNAAQLENFVRHSSSGNSQIDRAMIAEVKKILNIIPINPGFKFIDDPSPNAFAVPEDVVPDTKGTVYLGLNLINSEFNNSDYGGIAVAGICAHECGHIFQFQNGYMQSLAGPTAQLVELHADFIAGFYLGREGSHSQQRTEIFAQSLFSKGDRNFNSPQHHGTPQQRVAAMRKGYETGKTSAAFAIAVQQGSDFVRTL